MKAIRIFLSIGLCSLMLGITTSCKKYLDIKPDKTLVIPHHLSDLQALMDNFQIMNESNGALNEEVGGDMYTIPDYLQYMGIEDFNNYTWKNDASYSIEWNVLYKSILYSNIVLDYLPEMDDRKNQTEYNNIKGQALFLRSYKFFQLAELYCRPYSNSAATDLGIPLRLTADINIPSVRSTVQQTYDQITTDLKIAASLLPQMNISRTRPGKAAAFGMLARTYLAMRDYVNAEKYADSSLMLYSPLLDYNSLNSSSPQPIPDLNDEVLFYSIGESGITRPNFGKIDSNLYQSYDNNDLRKEVFFFLESDNKGYGFKGSYQGPASSFSVFNGLATDEQYLIRAECNARSGNIDVAMNDLNTLLIKRWKTGTFIPLTASNAIDALNKILNERRKELVYRNIRWTDLRRLNLEGANITLRRDGVGTMYTLPPNDLRWVILIPYEIISISGIQQNPR